MRGYLKGVAIAALLLLTLAPSASAASRRMFIHGRPYRPAWSWYRPYPYTWGWGWTWGPGYVYAVPGRGEVKLLSPAKGASVYVDGGYAGKADKLKKFPLRPGTHEIELRDAEGRAYWKEQVHVIAGKTVEIDAAYPS